MEHIIVLIGNRERAPLTDRILADLARRLSAVGAEVAPAAWLASDLAAEICVSGLPSATAEAAALAAIGAMPIDIAVVPAAERRKRLLVADMDSTIIGCECIDELADFAGLKERISLITERAMRGELDFPAALRERVGMLKGLSDTVLERAFAERVKLNPGAKTLIATMRKAGAYTALVSGGFTYFTSRVRRLCGFDFDQANELLLEGGQLNGLVAEPILDAGAKLQALRDLTARLSLMPEQTIAVGDGANDLPMLDEAGLGVAYHAKPKVAAAADVRIRHGDLTALLFLQGYRESEFAED